MFGTSGIRGEVGDDVTAELALSVGRALATEGYEEVVVGRDARGSGDLLADSVAAGIRECGGDVRRVGVAATPTIARSVGWFDADAGVVVTASHNPPQDNGLKLWNPSGQAFDATQRATVTERIETGEYALQTWERLGAERSVSGVRRRHVEALCEAVDVAGDLSVIVDVGNGTGGVTADALYELGCEVTTLNAQEDGRFPGRPSEPTAENCRRLRESVAGSDADLGVAHDGDADRMRAVAGDGTFVSGDVTLGLFARAFAAEGDRVAAPLNVSLAVDDALAEVGASLTRTRVGDVYVAERATEPDVVFGGEESGAWIWPAETLCPDGPLAACRLVELVERAGPLTDLVGGIETYPIRRTSVEVDDKAGVMDRLADDVRERYDDVDELDGVRVSTGEGWFLVRASGTQPLIRVTTEARETDRVETLFDTAVGLVETAVEWDG